MIVRISTEAQYELDESDAEQLNELDNAAVGACESEDEQSVHQVRADESGGPCHKRSSPTQVRCSAVEKRGGGSVQSASPPSAPRNSLKP